MNWFNKSNPLSERVKSPFYGSFLISWVIWNWRITLTVLLLKKEEFGRLNVVEYIATKYINIYDCIWIPLLISSCFILILPLIDFYIVWYTEWNKRKKIDKQLEISKKHSVSGQDYYDLRNKYEEERNKITLIERDLKKALLDLEKQTLISSEKNATILALENEKIRIDENRTYVTDLLSRLQVRSNASKFFNGRWTYTIIAEQSIDQTPREMQIEIANQDYRIQKGIKMHSIAELMLVDFDPDQKRLNFVKYAEGAPTSVTELNIINENRLEGYENKTNFVTYIRTGKLDLANI